MAATADPRAMFERKPAFGSRIPTNLALSMLLSAIGWALFVWEVYSETGLLMWLDGVINRQLGISITPLAAGATLIVYLFPGWLVSPERNAPRPVEDDDEEDENEAAAAEAEVNRERLRALVRFVLPVAAILTAVAIAWDLSHAATSPANYAYRLSVIAATAAGLVLIWIVAALKAIRLYNTIYGDEPA